MRVAIFGANGPTGRLLTAQALAAGHQVTAVTRHPGDIPPRVGMRVAQADATGADPGYHGSGSPFLTARCRSSSTAPRHAAGAAGFAANSRTAITRADLNALLYADGIHDSLYRTAGRDITSTARATADTATPQIPAMREGRNAAPSPA